MKRQEKTQDCFGRKDAKCRQGLVEKCEDLQEQTRALVRVKCRRMVQHVFCIFCFGSENWSWSHATLDRIRRWETKAMSRLFASKKEEDETRANYCTRTARVDRKIVVKMHFPFLSEVIVDSIWRLMDWACDERPNAVINTLKQVFRWRSTKWWQSTEVVEMKKKKDPKTRWKHERSWAQPWVCLGQSVQ